MQTLDSTSEKNLPSTADASNDQRCYRFKDFTKGESTSRKIPGNGQNCQLHHLKHFNDSMQQLAAIVNISVWMLEYVEYGTEMCTAMAMPKFRTIKRFMTDVLVK